jgi:hypothetical protein
MKNIKKCNISLYHEVQEIERFAPVTVWHFTIQGEMKGNNLLTTNSKKIQKLEKRWFYHVAGPVLLSVSTISLFYLCSFSFLSDHVIFGQIQN